MGKTICTGAEFSPAACKTGPPVRQRNQIPNDHEGTGISHDRVVSTILLLSNDDYLRPMIRAYLEHVGFAVISCTDALRASSIASNTEHLGLMLIDLDSSGAEALQVAFELQTVREGMPAVILSASGLTNDETDILDRHAWKLLRKPLQLPELLAVIRQILDRDKLQAGSYAPGNHRGATNVVPFPARNAHRTAPSLSPPQPHKMALIWCKGRGDHRRQ